VKAMALSAALTVVAVTMAPVSQAEMQVGNYQVQTPRDPGHLWIWAIRPCTPPGCLQVAGIPQPNGQAAPWSALAHLAGDHYTMVVDVPDGVRCVVYFLPSHDTYTWDAATLAGSVQSSYDQSCGGGPGGSDTYPFQLVRW
jgi:hypothetical protein